MYKRKIISKYHHIRQEIKKTNEILERAKLEIDEKVGLFLKGDNEDLVVRFTEINQELETFHSKLCFIQHELEDGRLIIENDVASCLNGTDKEKLPDVQSGTPGSLRNGGHLEQVESVSSLSSQNDQISYGRNIFHEHLESQHQSDKKSNTALAACSTEVNIADTVCNEPCFPSLALPSNISCLQHNNIKINTVNSVKETNIGRDKFPQNVKSTSVMEHVSSSDGSSVYCTVSSVCSEVQVVDKSETSASNELVKHVHSSEDSLKQIKVDPNSVRVPEINKQNIADLESIKLNSENPESNKWKSVDPTVGEWNSVNPEASKWNSDKSTLRFHSTGHSLNVNIPYPDLKIGSNIIATVQDISSPSDFWIQIDSMYSKELCPVTSPVTHLDGLRTVKKDTYCLAPFKQHGEYFRATILEVTEKIPGKQRAKVLYVDLGCKGSLYAHTLKVLPSSLQKIPSIAVHCALHGVVPADGKWSYKAIEEFKNTLEFSDTKFHVFSRVRDTYFMQVTISARMPENKMFTYDMAHMLCEFNFAVKENNVASVQLYDVLPSETCTSVASSSSNSKMKLPVSTSPSNDFSSMNKNGSFMTEKSESSSNNMSHDLNILNYKFQQAIYGNKEIDKKLVIGNSEMGRTIIANKEGNRKSFTGSIAQNAEVYVKNISNHKDNEKIHCVNVVIEPNSLANNKLQHHESKNSVNCSVVPATETGAVNHSVIVTTCNLPYATNDNCKTQKVTDSPDEFDWNVNIPFPSQKFKKKAKFIVMISAIVNPSDFYVNLAMPTSTQLDDLQENMISVYQNLGTSGMVLPPIDKLPGKFCCCQFAEDKNWYRVQVLELCNSLENVQNSVTLARIQYVDYGNEAVVNINDLIPLKKQFANFPAFSYHCSLAGIKPKLSENSSDGREDNKWSAEAISRFKHLTNVDRFFTAEIANTVTYDERKTVVPVYLWDTVSTTDILINAILVEQGAANGSDLELLNSPAEGNLQDIDQWDPMACDYYSTLNSYGVNMCDPEVATVGHKATDESYVCKFFSTSGKCPRGDKCYYQHIFTFGDSTVDKEILGFLGESISLPEVNSTVYVVVSAMYNPGRFFVVFPFGTASVESIQSELRRSIHKEEDAITEFMEDMNKYYNRNIHRKDNTALAPAYADLVAVKWNDGRWYRGRINEVFDITAPLMVYFVDFGNCETIHRANVRELEPQFRHFPFQAVQCHLHGIEPKVSKEGQQQIWSEESKNKFKEITESKTLFARIKSICSSSLYVELFTCSKDEELSINEYLVLHGYGQYRQWVSYNNSVSSHNSRKERQEKNVVYIPA